MRKLLISASAIALVATAAACSQSTEPVDTAVYDADNGTEVTDVETVDNTMDTAYTETGDTMGAQYVMAAGEYRASTLIGSPVTNSAGEEIATVADLYLGEGAEEPMIVVREGGAAGVGGTLHTLSFDNATFSPRTGETEPEVSFQISEDGIEALPEFEQDGMNDYRLASEMIGTNAQLSFSDDIARINDLLIGTDGMAKKAVVSEGVAGGDSRVIAANAITVSQGDGEDELMIDLSASEFAAAETLRLE